MFFVGIGYEGVNIVPVEMLEKAKTKMIAAVDWSLQRWNEEGKVAAQDIEGEEGHIDVDSIIEGEIGRKRANDTHEEEVEEEEEEEEEVEEKFENDPVDVLGESARGRKEEADEEDEEEEEEVVMDDAGGGHGRGGGGGLQFQASAMARRLGGHVPGAGSPRVFTRGGCGGGGEEEGKRMLQLRGSCSSTADHNVHLPVGSFASEIPSIPGRGFVQFDTYRGSQEQLDVQPMEESEEDERPQSAESSIRS